MGFKVMPFNVVHVDGFRHTWRLVYVPCKAPDIRIVDDTPEIAFEMRDVHCVETHECRKQPHVGLG